MTGVKKLAHLFPYTRVFILIFILLSILYRCQPFSIPTLWPPLSVVLALVLPPLLVTIHVVVSSCHPFTHFSRDVTHSCTPLSPPFVTYHHNVIIRLCILSSLVIDLHTSIRGSHSYHRHSHTIVGYCSFAYIS